MATSPTASSSSSPTASSSSSPTAAATAAAAAAATMAAEATEGPVLGVVSKRLRALRKKYNRITQTEESRAAGKTLNPEQEELLRSKSLVGPRINLLERLYSDIAKHSSLPAPTAASADSDSSVQDLLNLFYFGSLFDVKQQSDFTSLVNTRELERNRCLNDIGDDLKETDLNEVAALASLAVSRPRAAAGVSHHDALQDCARHTHLWLRRADEPIHPDSTVTYAGVRAKLDRIMASGYFEMPSLDLTSAVASFGAGDVQKSMVDNPAVEGHKESKVVSPQAPEAVKESPTDEGHKDGVKKAFFIDDTEMQETFMGYIRPNTEARTLIETAVPGDNRKYVTGSPRARRGTCSLIAWSFSLYGLGYYLDGDFTGDDFGVDLLGNLRGRMTLLPLLKKISPPPAPPAGEVVPAAPPAVEAAGAADAAADGAGAAPAAAPAGEVVPAAPAAPAVAPAGVVEPAAAPPAAAAVEAAGAADAAAAGAGAAPAAAPAGEVVPAAPPAPAVAPAGVVDPAAAPRPAAAVEAAGAADAVAKKMLCNQSSAVAKIIEKDIYSVESDSQLPSDVSHLLKQLRKDEIDCLLILNHVAHEEVDAKSDLFMKMYKDLKTIEKSDPTTYEDIITEIGKIPDVEGWIQRAMLNGHLHTSLRHKQRKSNAPKDLKAVISSFLRSGVRYGEDAKGLIDFRRNGYAHLQIDYSVDSIGYMEAGFFGASKGLVSYYQQKKQVLDQKQQQETESLHTQQEEEREKLQQEQEHEQERVLELQEELQWQQQGRWRQPQQQLLQDELTKLLAQLNKHEEDRVEQQQRHMEELKKKKKDHQQEQRQLLLQPLPQGIASWMSLAISDFLLSANYSVPAAIAGAEAAAMYILAANTGDMTVEGPKAEAAARTAASSAAATPAPSPLPSVMFTESDINNMYEMFAPNMLSEFQEIMYKKGKCFRLGNDKKVPKLD